MAVPKRKTSKSRTNSRFANWKTKKVNLVECPQCHALIKQHTACPKCGYYNGVQVYEPKKEKEDKE